MQFAKDSFYMELRSRVAVLNPERVVTIDGRSQPAILVNENEAITSAEALTDCFYVCFGAVKMIDSVGQCAPPLMLMDVKVAYCTRGNTDDSADRGRALGQLDSELLALCSPRRADKCDYTQDPPVMLGTRIFWSAPDLGEVASEGAQLSREATLNLYFYPEDTRK